MEKIYEQTLLYDFYGELLTEHQRQIYEDAVYNDLSLGEIAKEQGISRQGVHDLIRRCDKILQDYESKLHLVERFAAAKEKISQIEAMTFEDPSGKMSSLALDQGQGSSEGKASMDMETRLGWIRQLARELMETL